MHRRVHETAARQHGVVSREQALEAGLSPSAVGRLLQSGRLRQLYRGVYLVGPLVAPRTWHMAAALASRGGVVSHASAASLWGMHPTAPARHDAPAQPIDVTVCGANRGRRPGIRLHRVQRLDAADETVLDRIPLTTPARTLIDLAGVMCTREFQNAVARAEHDGIVRAAELSTILERHRGKPGSRALRTLLSVPDGSALTRSEAESRFLDLIREAGLPFPDANVRVGPYEVDFLWRSARLAVEVDGFRYHSSRVRFEGDRRKDAWLLGAGIHVVRLSWRQITHESMKTAVQLGNALQRASAAQPASAQRPYRIVR